MLANVFINEFNSHDGLSVPTIDLPTLGYVFLTDPFIDKDGDGRVRGRFLRGLIETLGPFLGVSGDLNDSLPSAATTDVNGFFDQYQKLTGIDLRTASPQVRIDAMRQLFGIAKSEWVRGFGGSRVLGFSGSRVLGFPGSRVPRFSGSQVLGFPGSRVPRFSGSQVLGSESREEPLFLTPGP
jgi:hypothetical protein